jgi:hypothetical protein
VLLFATITYAQEQHHHDDAITPVESLGTVSFPISCPGSEQTDFNRGMALLHSFSYNNAQLQFHEISEHDPSCAMTYWGEAMSLYRQLWERPDTKKLAAGSRLVQRAESCCIKTDRERALINAAAAFYVADPTVTYEVRRDSYSKALRRAHESRPDDDEISLFYALSLLTSPDAKKNDFAITRQASSSSMAYLAGSRTIPGRLTISSTPVITRSWLLKL